MSNIGRRSFVKKSVAGVILAATPLAMTSLINAQGGGEGTGGTKDTTIPPYETTIEETTIIETTIGPTEEETTVGTTVGTTAETTVVY